MKKAQILFFALLPLVFFMLVAGASHQHSGNSLSGRPAVPKAPAPISNLPATGFAVVELFTSEGCSSCPAADEALARLAHQYPDNVYVLGFHVDYWDRLGWRDIYSSGQYTNRQREYAQQFSLRSIYTPEAVVNGQHEFVGSDEDRLRSAVKEELTASTDSRITLAVKSGNGKNATISYHVENPGKAVLQIALVQSQAVSQVLHGENEGRRLQHINVVRNFKTVSPVASREGLAELKIPDGLLPKDCKVIAFLQEPGSGKITNASQASIQ